MNKKTSLIKQEAFITLCYKLKIIAYNEAAEEFFKIYSKTSLISGRNFADYLPSALVKRFQDKLGLCKTGKFQTLDFYPKGSNFKFKFYLSPVLDNNGSFDKIAISIDKEHLVFPQGFPSYLLNEKKDLAYNQQVYSNLFYNNPDPVFILNSKGNFINVNPSCADLAEISIDKLHQKHPLELIGEDDHKLILHRFMKTLNGKSQKYLVKFTNSIEEEKTLEINSFPFESNGQIIGVYGVARDVTSQKNIQKKAIEERQMLRAIIDNIPDYIFVKDRDHKAILTNKKFYTDIIGHSSDFAEEGYSPRDYFEPGKAREVIEDNNRVMQTGNPVINRPDIVTDVHGKQEMVLLTKVPLKNHQDETIGLVGIARDITQTYLQNKKQELIFKIIKAFGDNMSFAESMVQALQSLCEALGFDYAEAYKVGLNNQNLVRTAYYPPTKDFIRSQKSDHEYLIGEGLPGIVLKSGKIKVLRQDKETELLENLISGSDKAIKTAVGFPIYFQGNLIAIFCLGSTDGNKKIEEDILDDITLQIASAIERKRSQDQLNDFFRFSPNLMAVIGMDGFIKKINPSFIEKFGFSESEILTRPFTDYIHPDDLNKTYHAISNISIDGSDFELRCLKKDGQYLWISWRFSQYFSEENVVFIYGTDITPLKKVHAELSENIATRKKIQNKLEDSEQMYKSLFDSSPIPMWVLNSDDLRFLQVNSAAIDLYGYSAEEFYKMTVKDIWATDNERKIEAFSEKAENLFQVKLEHKKKNGERIIVVVHSNPMIYAGKQARIVVVRNVTATLKVEERLLHSENRFKALVQEGSDIISIIDDKFNYVYNSPAAKTVFGLEPSEMIGTSFKAYIHENDLEKITKEFNKLKNKKRIQLPSYRVKSSDNSWSWIETIITNLSDDPAIAGIVMNSRDITEFVEQERKLIESLRRYDIVAKATSDLITDYDIEKDEMKVSDVAAHLFGYTNEEGVYSGDWWNDKIHPEDRENVKSLEKKMHNNGLKNLTTEYRFRCADGSYKYILDRSYLIVDENDKPKRIIGSMQDITERKQHLIAIENHNKRLREIAWTQSHVVRAPLAKVMGLVDLLINYKNDLDNIDEILENVLNSANELDRIIREIAVQTEKEL